MSEGTKNHYVLSIVRVTKFTENPVTILSLLLIN